MASAPHEDTGSIRVSAAELYGREELTQPMSWPVLFGALALGLTLSVALASALADAHPPRVSMATRTPDPAHMAEAVEAYEGGDWHAAVRAFERILREAPGHARALDYLERIELTLGDAERLRGAEEALVAGLAEEAEHLALTVPPNSPLFSQAEAVARTARERREQALSAKGALGAAQAGLDVRAALNEAIALYEAGRFSEAATRAFALAESAQGEARGELLRWAQDARRFGEKYRALPDDSVNLVHHIEDAFEAVELDERLSDGHYARKVRADAASVLFELARVLLDSGDVVGGCARWKDAERFDARDARVATLSRRCEAEAQRRIAQARSLEASKPEQSLKLYRGVLELVKPDASFAALARERIDALAWSEAR